MSLTVHRARIAVTIPKISGNDGPHPLR